MAIVYMNSLDHYGPLAGSRDDSAKIYHIGDDILLGDGWSSLPQSDFINGVTLVGTYAVEKPAWGARSGDYALVNKATDYGYSVVGGSYTSTGAESLKLAIPGASQTVRHIHFAFSIDQLPTAVYERASGYICHFMDDVAAVRASLVVTPSGRLELVDGAGIASNAAGPSSLPTVLLTTSAPVIQPQTWYGLSIKITTNAVNANADIDVYIGDIVAANKVLSGTAVAFTDTGASPGLKTNIDVIGFLPMAWTGQGGFAGSEVTTAVRDIVITDTTGSYNTGLLGQTFVSAQEMRAEDAGGGWELNARQKIADGIVDMEDNNTGLYALDSASLEIGSSDFTFETFVRFHTLPGSSDTMNLLAKWRTNDNNRSYRLVYYGSDNTIRWEVSTDGSNTITVKNLPWTPLLDHWYNVAVVRASSQTMLFIDGVQIGVPIADSNTYYDSLASLGIGARFDGTSTLATDGRFDGWMGETRFTIGVARYSADYTPTTTPYGRNATDDPSFTSVVLLLGYSGLSLADESSYARTINTTTPAVVPLQPDDNDFKYKVLNTRPVIDDTYIEAPNTFAEGTFTFEAVPTATETLTVGSKVYTWVSTLGAANDVLIGADIPACISNIIAAINKGPGEGTVYGTGTTANADATAVVFLSPQFKLQATSIGTAGNSVATTETMANGFFGATTLQGGKDIPADSDFSIERLPLDVTGVAGIQVTTRQYKTDAGTAKVRLDLIGPSNGVGTGTEAIPDLNPAWARQIHEEDPDTSLQVTPSTLISGRIRFKRTV